MLYRKLLPLYRKNVHDQSPTFLVALTKTFPLLFGRQWHYDGISRFLHLFKTKRYLPIQFHSDLVLGGSSYLLQIHEDDCLPNLDLRFPGLLLSSLWTEQYRQQCDLQILRDGHCFVLRPDLRVRFNQPNNPTIYLHRLLLDA